MAKIANLRAVLVDLNGALVDTVPVPRSTYCPFPEQHGASGSEEEFARWNGIIAAADALLRILRDDHAICASRWGYDPSRLPMQWDTATSPALHAELVNHRLLPLHPKLLNLAIAVIAARKDRE